MAIYHLSFKLCKRSEGKSSVYLAAYQNRNKFTDNRTGAVWNYSKKSASSVAASAYQNRARYTDERTGTTYDYTKKGGLYYSGILAPENAPESLTAFITTPQTYQQNR